jgi:hypothetical protein
VICVPDDKFVYLWVLIAITNELLDLGTRNMAVRYGP